MDPGRLIDPLVIITFHPLNKKSSHFCLEHELETNKDKDGEKGKEVKL